MKWIIPILLIIGTTTIAVNIIKKQQRKSLSPKSSGGEDKKDSFSDRVKTGWNWITGQKIALPLLILAFAVMYTWREDWTKTLWDWMWSHWAINLTIVGLIIWWTRQDRHENKLDAATVMQLSKIGCLVVLMFVLFKTGGCIGRLGEPKEVADVVTQSSPPPTDIRMGSWTNIIAPGEWSEAIYFVRKTKVIRSGPAMVQKGKMIGNKFVPNEEPPRWVNKEDTLYFSKDGACRYYAPTTNFLGLVITRSW